MVDGVLYMSSGVGAVVALDPATGKTLWFDTLPPRPDGQDSRAAARRGASPTGPTAGRAHRHQRRRQPRRAEREDRQALSRLRRERSGRSDEGLRASDHRLALEQRPAGREGRHRRRRRARHRRPTSSTSATRAPKEMPPDDVRGYDVRTGKLLLDVPRRAAQGRVRQRHVAERFVDLLRQQRRVVADERRRGARLRLPAVRRSHRRLLRRHAARQQPVRRIDRVPRCEDRQARVALPDAPSRALGLRPPRRAHPRRHHRQRPAHQGAWRRCRSRRTSSSSIASPASRSGRSSRSRCRRATCPASGIRRRSRFRRSRRHSISRA